MDPQHNTEFDAAFSAGLEIAGAQYLRDGAPYAIVPENAEVKSLEFLLLAPLAIASAPRFDDLRSFISYVNAFAASPIIFAALTEQSVAFTAILDYHQAGIPKRGAHRATYVCAASPEWRRWSGKSSTEKSDQPFTQAQFADFIEDNLADIMEPTGAEVLEIARTLEAKQSVSFKAGVRLQNGDHSISYTSETKGAAGGNGQLEIPEQFILGIPPFAGSAPYKVTARLRYNIADGNLRFRYEIVRPHKIIEAACKDMVATVAEETGIAPLMGNP